jgi:hypothetical protein
LADYTIDTLESNFRKRQWFRTYTREPPRQTLNVYGASDYAVTRARCERPSCRCAAKQRDELAPLHSITSSAP